MSRKKIIIRIILFLLLASTISVYIRSRKVTAELKALKDYSSLYDRGFWWKRTITPLFASFEFPTINETFYCVYPIGSSYVKPVFRFTIADKYKSFPEDLWHEYYSLMGRFYHPDNPYSNILDTAGSFSLNKGYTVSEFIDMFGEFGETKYITWIWVDTYNNDSDKMHEYRIKANIDYAAQGFFCNGDTGLSVLEGAEQFVKMMNKYNAKTKSKTGTKIYEVKRGIKEEGDLELEDIKIIGCYGRLNDEKKVEELIASGVIKVIK